MAEGCGCVAEAFGPGVCRPDDWGRRVETSGPHRRHEGLESNPKALATWEDITPLARNEWICWIESAKKAETRTKRITWGCENLRDGKRRPCCWPGCAHRERGRSQGS
ncbi:MAG TPA: YdeI/OmpD-associated family protein [Caulobacteraceae bacterium]